MFYISLCTFSGKQSNISKKPNQVNKINALKKAIFSKTTILRIPIIEIYIIANNVNYKILYFTIINNF